MDELLEEFLIEGRELVTSAVRDLSALSTDPDTRRRLDGAFRAVHTLKGSVALFDMAPAGLVLHAAEDLLDHARKGTAPLDETKRAALIACIDRVDAWIDEMGTDGALSDAAREQAQQLLVRLGAPSVRQEADQASAVIAASSDAGWLAAMLAHELTPAVADPAGLTAFCYTPGADCFFRGDDPLAIVASVPKLAGLNLRPRDAWPAISALEPFRCHLVIEGLSEAPLGDVAAAFRLVRDQVQLAVVPAATAAPDADASGRLLRVNADRVDRLADGVGELIVATNALASVVSDVAQLDASVAARLRQLQGSLENAVGRVHRSVSAIRMVPVGPALRRLPRIVREVADTLGRRVDFVVEGAETEADKAIADALYEPLLHLVRNALDHGIEAPEKRIAAGKPQTGRLRLRLSRSGDQLVVALSDDGAGIDAARVRKRAVERGLVPAETAHALSDEAAQALIFTAGFSTAVQVSGVSGRGVGMDAVAASLDRLGGRIEVESRLGQGTTMRMIVPLNTITTRMLVVEAANERYAVPFECVAETVILPSERILPIGDRDACVLRNRTLPVVHLRELLGAERARASEAKVMVAEAGGERVAIVVDDFGERIEAMIRPASGLLAGMPGISGTTLLGNGDVMLVLDPEALIT